MGSKGGMVLSRVSLYTVLIFCLLFLGGGGLRTRGGVFFLRYIHIFSLFGCCVANVCCIVAGCVSIRRDNVLFIFIRTLLYLLFSRI